jgi:NAD(P)H-quinone oxidoreductase subunit 4
MLREIFYGPENKTLTAHEVLVDAEPREVFIISALLVPIIGIGFYPKLLTQIYDAKTQQVTARLREQVPSLAQNAPAETAMLPSLQMKLLKAPALDRV